jgi:DNA polymerase III delta prime subunit
MKFYETHFEEYLNENKKMNLHPKLDKIYEKLPPLIHQLKNILFYGPSGIGKYTQVLKCIKKYSPSELKYEKKMILTFNKQSYFFKISDVHYEVDMSLLGCNSRLLWHEIYQQITDSISAKNEKSGIIVCKYFHEIHSELLENFYSYMQKNYASNVEIKFILITEEISFIPDNLLNACEIISMSRPSKTMYQKCVKNHVSKNLKLENTKAIHNIKNLYLTCKEDPTKDKQECLIEYKIICDKIIENMIHIEENRFLTFRDLLYDLLIYHLSMSECIWYIISTLIEENKIPQDKISPLLIKTYTFFQYYNNNYRPIYHLENYLFTIVQMIHGF